MKIAIIGSGIAGNVAAYKLRDEHEITVFEAANYVGGHTNTINVSTPNGPLPVDTGFIVFNDRTYPNFIELMEEIGQRSIASEMSFSVHTADGELEYNGRSANGLFTQRRNFFRPSFYRMLTDIMRFNRDALPNLRQGKADASLGSYLVDNRYSRGFIDHYLVPMTAAIWSAEPSQVLEIPAEFILRFFDNHGLMQLRNRPQWRVIEGGSQAYVEKLVAGHRDRIRLRCPVRLVSRVSDGVHIHTDEYGREKFDAVFFACHSDQALEILSDETDAEREVLSAIRYQSNEAILHTDTRLLPSRERSWAAWNYQIPSHAGAQVTVTYNMNILQRLEAAETYCVTLNSAAQIDESKILGRFDYAHPMYTAESVAAQARQAEINTGRTYYCGAYWRNGFHEDGVVSALNAIEHFNGDHSDAQLHLRRAS
ncbi:MAG: FAD-dependent oxidoreductase [Pseudomonadota bacterium]